MAKIQNFQIVNTGQVAARFDIAFESVTIRKCILVQRDTGGVFISEPSEKYQKDGKDQYYKLAMITDDLLRLRLEKDAKELYRAKVEAGDVPQQSYNQAPMLEEPFPG